MKRRNILKKNCLVSIECRHEKKKYIEGELSVECRHEEKKYIEEELSAECRHEEKIYIEGELSKLSSSY